MHNNIMATMVDRSTYIAHTRKYPYYAQNSAAFRNRLRSLRCIAGALTLEHPRNTLSTLHGTDLGGTLRTLNSLVRRGGQVHDNEEHSCLQQSQCGIVLHWR